eukprot:3131882-Pyramimonas_sp.AAC.1
MYAAGIPCRPNQKVNSSQLKTTTCFSRTCVEPGTTEKQSDTRIEGNGRHMRDLLRASRRGLSGSVSARPRRHERASSRHMGVVPRALGYPQTDQGVQEPEQAETKPWEERQVAVLGGEDFILSQRSGVEEDL